MATRTTLERRRSELRSSGRARRESRVPARASAPRSEPNAANEPAQPARVCVLRLIAGVHTGAERNCEEGEVLLVGSAYDCDLVLADAQVERHHCVLSFTAKGLTVRALSASVTIGETVVEPGETGSAAAFTRIELGPAAALVAGRRGDPRWQQFEVDTGDVQPPRPPRFSERYRLPLTIASGLLLLLALVLAFLLRPAAPVEEVRSERVALRQLVVDLGLNELDFSDIDGRLRITGTVPDAPALETLQRHAGQLSPPAKIEVRMGDDIARDVREVLRLSRLNAETSYLGAGRVQIRGYFPEPERLKQALSSPSIAAIQGLVEVVPENLFTVEEPEVAAAAFQIASVILGDDPHIVAEDGARYYLGANLPGMGMLIAIDAHAIYVDTGHTTQVIPRPGIPYRPDNNRTDAVPEVSASDP